MGQAAGLGFFPNLMAAVVHQTFVGDCTIVQPIDLRRYLNLFGNPDAHAMEGYMATADRLVAVANTKSILKAICETAFGTCKAGIFWVRFGGLHGHRRPPGPPRAGCGHCVDQGSLTVWPPPPARLPSCSDESTACLWACRDWRAGDGCLMPE
jgi:hypothetical protein